MCNNASRFLVSIKIAFPSLLLHLAEIIGHLELGSSLFLHLLDSHARSNFGKSQPAVLAVNLEDTL